MHTARIVALIAAFSCAASAARAQYPQRRDGFWIGFGLGYGSANIKCDQCVDSSGVGGVTGFVKLGGTPSRNVLIGGAINVWAHSDGTGNTETMSRSEEHTSELQSLTNLVCRLLLEKKKKETNKEHS